MKGGHLWISMKLWTSPGLDNFHLKGIMHISSNPLAGKPVLPRISSVMPGPIDLKFSGAILGITGFLARGILEMCMIPFKSWT